MAPIWLARPDMTVKMVVPTFGSLDLIVIGRNIRPALPVPDNLLYPVEVAFVVAGFDGFAFVEGLFAGG